MPESVTFSGRGAFDNTAWYNNQPDGVIYINNTLYEYKGSMPENTTITIKEGTLSVSPCAFFYNYGNLTSVTIPSSVTSIGDHAFDGSSNLTEIHVNSETPATITSNTFSDLYSQATLYVPTGTKETYATAAYWKNFENIVEEEVEDTTGIAGANANEVPQIEQVAGGIKLANATDKSVGVYSSSGSLLSYFPKYTGETILLENGVYIIAVGEQAIKVAF